jgi:hypothetical protein
MNHDGGEKIYFRDNKFEVPDRPVIPFIEGDGTGPDIWRATRRVLDGAVQAAYGGRREIVWREVLAGEKAKQATGERIGRSSTSDLTLDISTDLTDAKRSYCLTGCDRLSFSVFSIPSIFKHLVCRTPFN